MADVLVLGVGGKAHPLSNPVVLDIRLPDGSHDNGSVDCPLGLQGPQDQDTNAGVELQDGPGLDGQFDAGHDSEVRFDDVRSVGTTVQEGQRVVETATQVVKVDSRRAVVNR